MLKRLLAAALFWCVASMAFASNTPLVVQIDRALNPSPVCVLRLTSGTCVTIGFISGADVWTPAGPSGVPLPPSVFVDTTDAANISRGTFDGNRLPNPAPLKRGGVFSGVAPANQFQNGINADGTGAYRQPLFADLADLLSSSQVPSGFTLTSPVLAGTPSTPGLNGYLKGNGGTGWTASPTVPSGDVTGLAPSATTDATKADNIGSGTLPDGRLGPNVVRSPVTGYLTTANYQSGTAYTIQASDCGKVVAFTNSSIVTATLPATLPTICVVTVEQAGAGQVSFAAGSGVTIVSAHGYTSTFAQYSYVTLVNNEGGSAATWNLTGDGS